MIVGGLAVLLLLWTWFGWIQSDTKIVLNPADFERPLSEQEVSEDLEFLARTIEQVHLDPYLRLSKQEFRHALDSINAAATHPMNRLELYRKLTPVVARLNDGHTNVKLLLDEINHRVRQDGKWFPLSIEVGESRVWVAGDQVGTQKIEAGSELVAINDIAIRDIITNLTRYVSSQNQSHRVETVESWFMFYLWLVYGFEDTYEVTIRTPGSNASQTHVLDGLTYSALLKSQGVNPAEPFSFVSEKEAKTGILTIDQFVEQGRFRSFLDEAFATIRNDRIEHLIIDLRANGGGSTDVSNELLRYLADKPIRNFARFDLKVSHQIKEHFNNEIPKPIRLIPIQYFFEQGRKTWAAEEGTVVTIDGGYVEPLGPEQRFEGRVYVLIGPMTFSTAADFAVVVKDFSLGTLIGEETGGMACSFGDTYLFRLPNSLLEVGVSFKKFVRPSGEITRNGIQPDHGVSSTPAEHASGNDQVLKFTRELISKSPSATR